MKKKYFHVRHFMKTSKTFCEAEVDALRAAIEFRKGLERSGIAKAKRVEKAQSGVKGITWHTRDKLWEVKLTINGKILHGGNFQPKDSTPEEVERARLAAVESCRKLEEKYVTIKQSEGPESAPVLRRRNKSGTPPSKDVRSRSRLKHPDLRKNHDASKLSAALCPTKKHILFDFLVRSCVYMCICIYVCARTHARIRPALEDASAPLGRIRPAPEDTFAPPGTHPPRPRGRIRPPWEASTPSPGTHPTPGRDASAPPEWWLECWPEWWPECWLEW